MALISKNNPWKTLVILGGVALLVALFYAEENWRGKRAWEKCKRELEAKGELLDWNAYIPPPVPDDQNFFKAPKMAEWFVKNNQALTNEFYGRLRNADTTATNLNETTAAKYLAWSDQFEPDFNLIREALKRPYARMDGDYMQWSGMPLPNFLTVRAVAQTLAQRAKCDLLLGQPGQALHELTLMHDMYRLLESAPTGKPMTLVAAMINVAVTGLYADAIADGLQLHAWQEPQLATLQEQLKEIDLPPFVIEALKAEPAGICHMAEIIWLGKLNSSGDTQMTSRQGKMNATFSFMPSGWIYQNMVNVAELDQNWLNGFDPAQDTISPRKFDDAARDLDKFFEHKSPYKLLAAIAVPNFSKAILTTARNQTLVSQGQIVCALERYHIAHGEYPETLDALVPQFIEKLPHDIIGGQPLHYRRTEGGKFLLYSVGWNETDDGGQVVLKPDGSEDREKGDWVWGYPAK